MSVVDRTSSEFKACLELYERAPRCVASLILADTSAGWTGSLSAEECDARLAAAGQLETLPRDEFAKAYLPGVLADDAPAHLLEELHTMMRDFQPATDSRGSTCPRC